MLNQFDLLTKKKGPERNNFYGFLKRHRQNHPVKQTSRPKREDSAEKISKLNSLIQEDIERT